jgi:hypothetical protein
MDYHRLIMLIKSMTDISLPRNDNGYSLEN